MAKTGFESAGIRGAPDQPPRMEIRDNGLAERCSKVLKTHSVNKKGKIGISPPAAGKLKPRDANRWRGISVNSFPVLAWWTKANLVRRQGNRINRGESDKILESYREASSARMSAPTRNLGD